MGSVWRRLSDVFIKEESVQVVSHPFSILQIPVLLKAVKGLPPLGVSVVSTLISSLPRVLVHFSTALSSPIRSASSVTMDTE